MGSNKKRTRRGMALLPLVDQWNKMFTEHARLKIKNFPVFFLDDFCVFVGFKCHLLSPGPLVRR